MKNNRSKNIIQVDAWDELRVFNHLFYDMPKISE